MTRQLQGSKTNQKGLIVNKMVKYIMIHRRFSFTEDSIRMHLYQRQIKTIKCCQKCTNPMLMHFTDQYLFLKSIQPTESITN